MIRCPFCSQEFIFESTLLFHIFHHHCTAPLCPSIRVRRQEDLLMMIASAVQRFTVRGATTSVCLMHYICSYGARINLEELNEFLIVNSSAIQFMLNSQTNVLSRYTDINKVMEYIQVKNLENDIIKANSAAVNDISTNYVSETFSKKLGKKKIASYRKKTIEILKSQTIKHYSNYLIQSKQEINIQLTYNYQYTMPSQFFKNIPNIPSPKDFKINNSLQFIHNIQSLDFLITDAMLYNNLQQILDDVQICEKNILKSLCEQKMYLMKLYIVVVYTNRFQDITYGIIDNNRQIINFLQFVNHNNIYSLDKYFTQFVHELDSWWLNKTIDMTYETKRIHSSTTILHNIIIDDKSVMQLCLSTDIQLNNLLILACLMTIETKLTLSNIFDHVRIIICVIKYNFIDKSLLRKVLNDLMLDL